MFIQVIQGKTTQQDQVRELGDRWLTENAPGAEGWLGGTYGFAEDGTFIAVVRFESRESAMANSQRPEQGQWWADMEKCFDGPIEFHDCADVAVMLDGGSDDAGFVQIVQGQAVNPEVLKQMVTDADQLRERRPEIIGATVGFAEDGYCIETVAFASEEAARKGEQQESMPQEEREALESAVKDVTYLDISKPWFASPS